jgi:hypothetical protein
VVEGLGLSSCGRIETKGEVGGEELFEACRYIDKVVESEFARRVGEVFGVSS